MNYHFFSQFKRITILLPVLWTAIAYSQNIPNNVLSPIAPYKSAPLSNAFSLKSANTGGTTVDLPSSGIAPDRILVKFKRTSKELPQFRLQNSVNGAKTGLSSLDELNVQFKASNIRKAYADVRNKKMENEQGIDCWYLITFEGRANPDLLAAVYKKNGHVEEATPDREVYASMVPNDVLYSYQWGHNNTKQLLSYNSVSGQHDGPAVGTPNFDANLQDAWDALGNYGSATVTIGIIDTGVDIDHPDLVNNIVAGYDFGCNDSNPDDNSGKAGHGTACAGVAAAQANNSIGIAGVAGGCRIMPLKVADPSGTMYFSAVQAALYYAADHDVNVVSMSLGNNSITSDPATDLAIQYAYNHGVVLLAASGNGNASSIEYPACNNYVIAVGAASPCKERKSYTSCDGETGWGSSYGTDGQDAPGAVDIIAPTILPATDIASLAGYSSGDYYLYFNGTSCATPFAAGVCALIKSKNPDWSVAQIRQQLVNSAIDINTGEAGPEWDRYTGYGMVDAYAALTNTPAEDNPPVFTATGPFTIAENSGESTVVGDIDANNGDGGTTDGGITYSITANTDPDHDGNPAFNVGISTGIIMVNDASDIDYDLNHSLSITVQASDDINIISADIAIYLTASTTSICYVAPGATGSGTSWSDPMDFQTALATVNSGDSIFVKYGTYKPTGPGGDRNATFNIPSGVAVLGHFAGTETVSWQRVFSNPAYETILSGDLNGDDNDFANNGENSYHVVYFNLSSSLTLLDGFTVTHGNSTYSAGGIMSNGAGGNNSSHPVIRRCKITLNFATSYGAGIFLDGYGSTVSSKPIIDRCTFIRNSTSGSGLGGALYISECRPEVSNCSFSGNFAIQGGAVLVSGWCYGNGGPKITNCTFNGQVSWGDYNHQIVEGSAIANLRAYSDISDCLFSANSSKFDGGAIYNYGGNITFNRCTFSDNYTFGQGSGPDMGGGAIKSEGSAVQISNCVFSGNKADNYYNLPTWGGALQFVNCSGTVKNTTFKGNWSKGDGGSVNSKNSSISFKNCLMTGNTALRNGGGIAHASSSGAILTNCTIGGNKANSNGGGIYSENCSPTIGNSLVWGNDASSSGDDIYNNTATPTISYCSIKGCGGSGAGWVPSFGTDGGSNLDRNPQFVGEITPSLTPSQSGDYHVYVNSPVVNAGNNSLVTELTDLDGNTRIQNSTVDMGCYENDGTGVNRIIYVKYDASGSNNGTSWSNAYTDMQSALETVVAGNNIYVARGTYKPDKNTGDRNSTFTIPTDVKVYGHFAGTEGMPYERQMDQSGNETILSGEIGDAGQVSDNSYHVVRFNGVSSSTFLDGFTVSDGNADGSGTENAGGGILNISSSNPTILNCLIKNNSAQNGAGMANSGYSSPAISNCNFMSNSSNNGGGVYNHDHSSPRVVNSFISGNSAGYGGGVYNTDSSSPVLINCVIMGNMADYGGAMAGFTSSAAEIINCSLAGNNASDTGGALYNSDASPLLKNTIIWGNNTSSGLITNEGTASPTFYNCDIETCGGSSAWDASYGTDGGNNMDSDPRFEDLRSFASAPFIEGYLHLYTGSPCSNTGNNSYVPADITTDIHAAARIQNTTVDMGAYEGVEMRGIIYVKSDAAGLNNGRSWNNAFIKLQSALKVAISGDLIYVAAGTYKPAVSSRDSSFVVVDGVSMYGHFAGTETSHTGRLMTDTSFETILSGDIGTPTLTTDNSYHVVKFSYLHTTPTFDGFTIQNGNADGSLENGFGGGIYVNGSGTSNYTNLNIYNCIIRDNNASSGGGGVYYNLNHGTCYGTLTKSVITGNTSNGRGGGVYVNCEPGGYSSSWINECTVTTNSAQYGGGIYVNAYNGGRASFNIANTLLNGNTASSGGGGYYYNGGLYVQQHPGMFNCTINGNRVTSGNGGGIYIDGGYHQAVSPNFVNCTLSGNEISTGYKGDALYCFRFASPLFKNSVLWGNSTIGGPVYRYTDYGPASPNPTFYYCDIQSSGGSSAWNTGFGTDGGNNLDMDPVFVVMPDFNTAPTTSGDCRLADTSPCKDAGLNSYNGLSTDLDNTARVKNTTIDMGPYESSTPRICAQPLTGGIVSASPTTVCYGTSGITFTSESLPTSYTGIPEYQWQYTTIASPTFSDWINTGTNSTVYTHSETVTQTTSFRRLSRVTCDPVDWSSAVSSNIISLNIYSPFSAGEILTTGETICYNGDPGTIGSFADATGGNLPVTYKWQSSASGDFSDAVNLPSGSSATYNPETLTSTTSFRRMAKDATCTPDFIASTGTWVVTVQQLFISGTIQTTGETICYGGDPGIIGSVTDAGGGNNSITYKWESSTDGFITSGTTIAGATSATFNPPAGLTATTSYRRYAKDGSCNTSFTASSGTWVVTVLPQFTAGAIQTAGETLCYGGNPAVIGSVTDAGGGDISITYKWESSTNGFTTSGTTITGATSSTYDPPAGLTSVTSYRRYAKDGTCNVSFTVSTGTWLVTVRPQFSAGTIQTTGESLCYGGDPGIIESVTDAGGGDNNITYKWESSTDGFTTFGTTITGATASSFNPPSGLTVTTSYRRYTREGTCNTTFTASAGSWVVTVRPPFTEGTIQTTGETVCYEGDPGLIGSVTDASGGNNSITYKWESSTDGFTTTGTTITGATSSSYNPPPGLTTTTSYRRYARDGACNTAFIASSGTWVVTVHLQFNSGAVQTAGQTIGFGGDPSEIGSATDASGGDNSITYQWESSTDGFTTTHTLIEGANQSSFDPPAGLTVNTSFRRYAKDGTCSADFSQSEGTWVVNVCSQFTPGEIADEGETICYNGNPGEIGNVMSAGGGDGNIDYKWESSTDGFITSGTVIDGATSSIYDPPGGLTVTTNYRRFAKDHTYNTTFEVSTGTWVVTVRPQFTAGTVQSAGETICTAGDPSEIGSVTNASGGDNSITYKWESSTEGFTTSGTTITGATSSFYNPPPGLTTTTSYRRYARDGACNTAFTPSSGTWLVTVYPPFTAGAIRTTGETICYGGNPATITSSVPGSGGDGSIAYRWESSTDGFTSTETVIDPATSANYDPPAGLTLTTWYRRQVREGTCNTNWTSSEGIWKVMVINDPPVISGCPDNITVYTNSSNPSSCAQSISWTEPTASDNCDGSLTFFSRDHAPGSSFPEGTTPVNYVFKDNQGNAATCTFSVTVIDNTPPVISGCPNNITAYSQNGDPSKCAQAVTWAEPTASDKCDGNLSYFSRNYGPGTLFPEGTTQVIYVFKDNEGNTATCTFSVTVIDNTPPVISGTPANITVYSNDYDPLTCSQLVSWTQPTAVDNCESSLSFFSRSHAPGASFNLGMTTVTYQFKDNEGNTSSCSFTVKVVDNTPPAAKCKNVTVVLDDSGNGTTTASAVNNESADACGIQGLNLDKSAFTCSNLGPNTVILTVTDVNGNSSSCTATVSVVDNIPPQITCKPSGQRFADPYKTYYTVSGTEFDASATDNCSVTSMKYSINGGPWSTNGASLSGIHLNLGSNTITWAAGDISSNTSTCSTVVTVQKRTTTLVYNGDLTEQYSDVTNLSATLRDISGGLPGAGVSGKTILFTIGSQSVSAVTGAGGTVSATLKITQLPGNYSVVTTFAEDDTYLGSNDSDPFVIQAETACGLYTGPVYTNTSGPATLTASITLSVIVSQEADGNVTNLNYPSNLGFSFNVSSDANGSVSLVGSPVFNASTSTFSQEAMVTIKTGNIFTSLDVSWTIGKGFTNVSCMDQQWILTVAVPSTDYAAGGGHIVLGDNSQGTQKGLKGTKNNFGFGIKWGKNFSKLTGNFNTIWRQADKSFQARSNTASALVITKLGTNQYKAQITYTNVNIRQLDCLTNCWSDGNGTAILTVYDYCEGSNCTSVNMDKIGIAIRNKTGTLVYSSNTFDPATTDKTTVQSLAGGNIQVKPASTKSAMTEMVQADEYEPHLLVYPNPFSDKLRFEFSSPADGNARIDLFDITGRLITTVFNSPVKANNACKAEFVPEGVISSIYLYRLTLDDKVYNGKVIFKK